MNRFLRSAKSNFFPFIVFSILVACCCLGWYYFHPSSPYFERYTFVVSYQAIGTLSPGNRVIVRGMPKGKILEVELTDDAVFVKVEVLADTKISKKSEFRLINAGLMGEREMCIMTADDSDWVAEGDTVVGSYDDGAAGLGKAFITALADLDTMNQMILSFKDSLTFGAPAHSMERVIKKGKRLMNAGNTLIEETRDQAKAVLERGESTLQKVRSALESVSDQGKSSVEKGSSLLERTDALLTRVKEIKAEVQSVAAKLDSTDNTAGLVASGRGKLISEMDRLSVDIERLISDIKKSGLRLNVDIF